jgi:hypothetical protein
MLFWAKFADGSSSAFPLSEESLCGRGDLWNLPTVLCACREQRLDDCSLQTGPRFCLAENAFPVRRISGVFRSVLGFLINDDFLVERKRISDAPAMWVSHAVSGFLTAYDHLWRKTSYHNMKGLV